ncbi:hypothetical protein OAR97_06890, partial [Arcobacteraceae bacterium]|nr:hypothetical protein [Arcobacteraceae bacterium]
VYDFGVFNLTSIEKDQIDLYKYELFKTLTLISGNLSFLAIQILAANSIMKTRGFHKINHFLQKKCGIAINHLRVPKTIVWAEKVEGGFILHGILSWASGYKIFDTLLIGFHCDNLEYEVMADFKNQDGFSIGEAPKTFVGNGLNTVNIELNNFFVKDENIVASRPLGNYTEAKAVSTTIHLCLYSLGNAVLLNTNDEEFKQNASLKLDALKEIFLNTKDTKQMNHLRVELFELVQSIITTAMTLYGGKCILSTTNLQRFYREIIMFNVNGLNTDLKEISKTNFLISKGIK